MSVYLVFSAEHLAKESQGLGASNIALITVTRLEYIQIMYVIVVN